MYKANLMWKKITKDNFRTPDINNFRSNGPNNRLATAYNPKTHGVLFFKTILYNMAQKLTANDRNILKKIKNRDYGHPLSIKYTEDLEIDIDYLQSLNEIKFLDGALKKITSVCEIGAGYGRSVHSILFLYPSIEKYFVFDLKPVLELAKSFLVKVLPEELYKKIVFLSVGGDDDVFDKISADLCININSFQEMDFDVIQNYLHWISKHCKYFYSNNTIGKFSPQLCGFSENPSTEKPQEQFL